MSNNSRPEQNANLSDLYEEAGHWHVNTGGETIHAKRIGGRFRRLKWMTSSIWLLFFLGPYLRWGGRQAILYDIPNRQFHFFGLTILPQDVWMLSLVLLFLAIVLIGATVIAGRVFCGFFCFQTAWTDVFTWIEDKLEGPPAKRRKLDKAPWDATKIRIKFTKHFLWLLIAVVTGVTFAGWFTDIYQLWYDFFTLQAHPAAWVTLGLFIAGTYILAGFMREQVCFWLCPYSRIQGVMYEPETILPTYDVKRGEPRGRLKKGASVDDDQFGDCVDCNLCVAVCPTGVDIRHGQQEGCITCGLCIDACDQVMDKVNRPHGLIRYASLDEIEGKPRIALFKRPKVLVSLAIITIALLGIIYGVANISGIELKVLHDRQPLFVLQSDGSIQNRYEIKVLNKTSQDIHVKLTAEGPAGLKIAGAEKALVAPKGNISAYTVFVRVPKKNLAGERVPIIFRVSAQEQPDLSTEYESMFFGPRR